MNFLHKSVSVCVPATSANLGPGFDVLGLAFQKYNRFVFHMSKQAEFIGCPIPYQNEDNIVYQASQFLFREYTMDPSYNQTLRITFQTDIPEGRGLGSSASCIVGGLLGANLMIGSPYDKDALLQMAASIEGHADNVASALYGGLTIVTKSEENYLAKSVAVSSKFDFFLVIPDFKISTEKAREVLPEQVSLTSSSLNIANTALEVLAIMEGNACLLHFVEKDYLYEKARKGLIPNYDDIKEAAARCGGCHFSISGSGPTMLIMAASRLFQKEKFEQMLRLMNYSASVLQVKVDHEGATCQILERM